MECLICVTRRKKYKILICGHILCSYCENRLKEMNNYKCHICRTQISSTIDIDSETLEYLLINMDQNINDESNVYLNVFSIVNENTEHERQFNLLFTDKYALQYKLGVICYLHKWAVVDLKDYELDQVCSICKHFGLTNEDNVCNPNLIDHNRSLLCNLYYNTVPCNIYTVIDAAVISLLSIKSLKIDEVSPKDIAYHYFQNNCITEGRSYEADLLQMLQHHYILTKNPYKELYIALSSNKIKVLDVKQRMCPCNKTKREVNDIVLNELKNNTIDNNDDIQSVEKDSFDGFLFSDSLVTSLVDLDDSFNKHDDRMDFLRISTSQFRTYIDKLSTNVNYHFTRDTNFTIQNLQDLLPTSLNNPTKNGDPNSASWMSSYPFFENEVIHEEIIEIIENQQMGINNHRSRQERRMESTIRNQRNPKTSIIPLSVFSTCEICLAEIKFTNYKLMTLFREEQRPEFFKGSNNKTMVSIMLEINRERIKEYISRTFNIKTDGVVIDEDFMKKITEKFSNHFLNCVYDKQRFIPVKALFKSLHHLKNKEFTNHTFHKLFDGDNKLLCSKTFLCAFIENKCRAFEKETCLVTNSQILKLVQNTLSAHKI